MNLLTIGQSISGFEVIRKRENAKLGGALYEFVHRKTGAELCFVDNGAENKLFSVAFKTIPENSTGVFHILEHSVLCGSEKFPVREPFLELLKGSMNTFLNALTFPDKTVYPVSSRNEKDFLNLTEVYLDAVFAPLLLENKNIFYQEGRHLECGEDGKPFYNGVVLNEMKGAMSNVDRRVSEGITALLFPDTCYRYNSGGAPDVIPDLTYEKYVETYRRFYHPSNARFFLDGDLPLEKTLALIDNYLDHYEKAPLPADIAKQTPVSGEAVNYYATTETEGPRDILSYARLLGSFDDVLTTLSSEILCDILASSNESPLKRALLSAGLCEDMELYVEDGMCQTFLALILRNTEDRKEPEVRKVVREVITRLLKEGISKDELTASVNKMEFSMREMEEPQALVRNLLALRSWLYGGDPMLYLDTDGIFASLRAMIPTDAFEKLLEKLFLSEEGVILLRTLPSLTLTGEEEAAAEKRAADDLKALSGDALEVLQEENKLLKIWQETPDSPEALATLPALSLSDVDPTPKKLVTEFQTVEDTKVLYHPLPTNGVTHLSLYFPLTGFSTEELAALALLPELYGELSTSEHDLTSLQRELKTHIGNYSFDIGVFSRYDDNQFATPCLTVTASFLDPELPYAESLIAEILTSTDFSDSARILELVRQIHEFSRQRVISSGHATAAGIVRAAHSASAAARLATNGFDAMKYNHTLSEHFDEEFPKTAALIDRFNREALGKQNLIIGVTAEKPVSLDGLLSRLPDGKKQPKKAEYRSSYPAKVGVRIPAPVSYAAMGYHPFLDEKKSDGALRVAANIASLSYLWNKVRVQGGAYGAGFSSYGNEGTICYSYRDPAPERSLETFTGIADFLREFASGDESIDKYIISSIASGDPLLSPKSEGLAADSLYFSGITEEMRANTRREMLETDRPAILRWASTLDNMKKDGVCAVVARDETLEKIEGLEITEL